MAILIDKVVFGIVLYNQELDDSVTFNSLLKSLKHFNEKDQNILILIFDNTSRVIEKKQNSIFWFEENQVKLRYITENENRGLPYAYNTFAKIAKEEDREWLVLLDQDTELPTNFIKQYIQIDSGIMLHCPLVFSNENLMSPSYYKCYRTSAMAIPESKVISLDDKTCINSGLMINVEFFIENDGYNKKLFLDFCDHDFILKVKAKSNARMGIIPVKLIQEFSAVTHKKKQALYRYDIFLRDLKVFYKNKNVFIIFLRVDLPRLIKLTYSFKTFLFIKKRLF